MSSQAHTIRACPHKRTPCAHVLTSTHHLHVCSQAHTICACLRRCAIKRAINARMDDPNFVWREKRFGRPWPCTPPWCPRWHRVAAFWPCLQSTQESLLGHTGVPSLQGTQEGTQEGKQESLRGGTQESHLGGALGFHPLCTPPPLPLQNKLALCTHAPLPASIAFGIHKQAQSTHAPGFMAQPPHLLNYFSWLECSASE